MRGKKDETLECDHIRIICNNYNTQFIMESIKDVKITDCDGKRNKVKILLLKYFPYFFWKISRGKGII